MPCHRAFTQSLFCSIFHTVALHSFPRGLTCGSHCWLSNRGEVALLCCVVVDFSVLYVMYCTLQNVRSADWTEYVTPFWPAVIATAMTFRGFLGLLKAGEWPGANHVGSLKK